MTPISSPMAGDVHPLADVPDPVFAQGLVGPGVAIVPIGEAEVTVVAPIAGRIVKLHPHAFVIQAEGFGVLVHLGIDTVQLDGRGFLLHATEGDQVAVGTPLISWNPSEVVAGGRSAMCPVVVLDVAPESVTPVEVQTVEAICSLDKASSRLSALNSGCLSEKTKVAVSLGEKPCIARARESSESMDLAGS